MANKQELVDFLDKHVFQPILNENPDRHHGADRKKLEDVQDSTRSEIDRFKHYRNAEEVVTNYKRDLHSEAAKKVNRELEALHLPTLRSVEDEFLRLAGERSGEG